MRHECEQAARVAATLESAFGRSFALVMRAGSVPATVWADGARPASA